jgi:hypothetical protein
VKGSYRGQFQILFWPLAGSIVIDISVNCSYNKQNNTNNKFGRVLAVTSLCEFYSGICLTTEGKARINLSQGTATDSSVTPTAQVYEHHKPTFGCTANSEARGFSNEGQMDFMFNIPCIMDQFIKK